MFKTFGFMKHPYQMEGPGRSCDLQEDDDALYARVDMPSVAKEGLKMWVENNSLYITGEEGEKDEDCLPEERTTLQLQNESERRKFSTSIAIAPRRFKTDEIKAVLKNGVLRVVIPKLKHGETSKFVHIMIN
uniref:SHSP domain-containing protein n=1 Tax=Davidia involucrata TaxID=16924 RepID=A0A5B6YLR4_DAVIN